MGGRNAARPGSPSHAEGGGVRGAVDKAARGIRPSLGNAVVEPWWSPWHGWTAPFLRLLARRGKQWMASPKLCPSRHRPHPCRPCHHRPLPQTIPDSETKVQIVQLPPISPPTHARSWTQKRAVDPLPQARTSELSRGSRATDGTCSEAESPHRSLEPPSTIEPDEAERPQLAPVPATAERARSYLQGAKPTARGLSLCAIM